jgi:hypothetical protein
MPTKKTTYLILILFFATFFTNYEIAASEIILDNIEIEYIKNAHEKLEKTPITQKELIKLLSDLINEQNIEMNLRSLSNLVEDPKGDSMCQLWAMLPVLYEKGQFMPSKNFMAFLYLTSIIFPRDKNNKRIESVRNGGITDLARCDMTVLRQLKLLSSFGKKKRNSIANLLLCTMRAIVAEELYRALAFLDDDGLVQQKTWRENGQKKPVLMMPFFTSYQLFNKLVEKLNIKIAINYLQYVTKINGDTFDDSNNKQIKIKPVILKEVDYIYPVGEPKDNESVIMIDMYSAFDAESCDDDINLKLANLKTSLKNQTDFFGYVLQIAAAHKQFIDSQIVENGPGEIFNEKNLEEKVFYNDYLQYLNLATKRSIGITNIYDKRYGAVVKFALNKDNKSLRAIEIPLNTIHVYFVPVCEIKERQDYWKSFVNK